MPTSIENPPKRRGRPTAGGRQQGVMVRMSTAQLAALDAWIAQQTVPFSRPEAIRAMVAAMLELMGRPQAAPPVDDTEALDSFLDRFEER